MTESVIRVRPSRLAAAALLEAFGLPTSDLTDEHMNHFFYCGDFDAPAAIVGVEMRGADALLRSLVVTAACRSRGLGGMLTAHAEQFARAQGARSMYLLTTTAQEFFERRGYVPAGRETAPAEIRASTEFADMCPADAAFLAKRL